MSTYVGPASMQEHEAVMKAMYGSVEKMREHPTYLEVVNRIEYLEQLKTDLYNLMEEEKANARWYHPINYLASRLSSLGFKFIVDKPVSEVIRKFKDQKSFPIGFVVGSIIDDMQKCLAGIYELIEHRNHKYFINDDIYLKEAAQWKESQKH